MVREMIEQQKIASCETKDNRELQFGLLIGSCGAH